MVGRVVTTMARTMEDGPAGEMGHGLRQSAMRAVLHDHCGGVFASHVRHGGDINTGQAFNRGAWHFPGQRAAQDQQLPHKAQQRAHNNQPPDGGHACHRMGNACHEAERYAFFSRMRGNVGHAVRLVKSAGGHIVSNT